MNIFWNFFGMELLKSRWKMMDQHCKFTVWPKCNESAVSANAFNPFSLMTSLSVLKVNMVLSLISSIFTQLILPTALHSYSRHINLANGYFYFNILFSQSKNVHWFITDIMHVTEWYKILCHAKVCITVKSMLYPTQWYCLWYYPSSELLFSYHPCSK